MQYTFGVYTLDTQRYELCQTGLPVQLQPKVFDLLAYLLQHHDRVVTRQELFDTLWPEHFVSDDALEWVIAAARRAIGDSGRAQRVIQTVRTRGYRWVAPVVVHPTPLPDEELLPDSPGDLDTTDSAAVPLPVAGERKQVTVLACTLSSLVTQAAGLDPETLYTVRQRVFALAQQEVQRYAGTIQHFVDNTCLAVFGAPVAQEDHARRAVLAALGIQDSLRHPGTMPAPEVGRDRAVCTSVHTGEVIVGPIGNDPRQIALAVGDTTQMADQLLRLAEPGAIVLSAATERLLPGLFRLARVSPVPVPGMPTPPAVYQVLGLAPRTTMGWQGRRVVRQFVGRAHELATLQALLTQVAAGHGQVVGLAGEPGMGKSRLLYEFRQRMPQTSYTFLLGRCVSYGQATPYLPLLDLVRQACGVSERETLDDTVARVRQSLQTLGMNAEAEAPYLLRLLNLPGNTDEPMPSLSSQVLRARIFAALLQMQLHASTQRPLVLAVEDVHWIDPTSDAWLLQLVDRLVRAPILLLVSYRSGYQPAWLSKSYATQLALSRLTAAESRRLVRAVLPLRTGADELVQTIVVKGEGNPFFLEELAQNAADHGDPSHTLALPETVQAVLAARLDRLPPATKTLAQVAAVIGAEVPGVLLQAVMALPDTALQQHLAPLLDAELLYEARSGSEPVYAFQHALTHEVAFQSLLRRTRQYYHQQIADLLVTRFTDTVETQPEIVAHHYTEASRYEQAFPYWHQAGERAAGRAAYREAIAHCTQGLEVLQRLPDTPERARYDLRLHLTLAGPLVATKGPGADEVGHVRRRARELCEHVGDERQRFQAITGLYGFHGVRGELRVAREIAEQALRLVQRSSIALHHLHAHLAMGWTSLFLGELVAARTSLERALTFWVPQSHGALPPHREIDHPVPCLAHLAMTLGALGYPDQALARAYEALRRAQEISHPYSLAYALVHVTWIHRLRREVQATREQAEVTLTLCEEHEFTQWLTAAWSWRGWALVAQGQAEEGVALIRQGIVDSPDRLMRPYEYAVLAEACADTGQVEEGLTMLTEQLDIVEGGEGRFYTAELYRLQGELVLRQTAPDAQQAERCFHHALGLARRAQAKWWELRAAMSLCRLWQRQGKRQEAHQLLAPVYGWFTEGFDTADLQEAQALLHQLSDTP